MKAKEEILVTDPEGRAIRILDKNGNFLRSIIPNVVLERPGTICVSSKNEIYIEEMILEKIFVFDENFNLLREFGDERLQMSLHMKIDDDTDTIFMTSYLNNTLTVWNCATGEFINNISINSPLSLTLSNDKLFVLSANDVGIFSREYTIQINENNQNCMYVLDKKTLEILKSINISSFVQPKGLTIDSEMNFIITATDLHLTEVHYSKKQSTCLLKINEKGDLLQKTVLGFDGGIIQVLFFENKIAFSRAFRTPRVYLAEFN